MKVQHFYDFETYTLTYIVYDENSLDALIIDPVLDFDQPSGKVFAKSLESVFTFISEKKLNLLASLETHAHADHLSGSQILKKKFPNLKIGISEKIKVVQEVFKDVFHIDYLKTDASQFDLLLQDFKNYKIGALNFKAIPTPGHTPACMSYLFGDFIFTGDALFMPDYGTGRCDFPRGSAKKLFQSIKENLYTLPDSTKVYVGHDYCPNGRELKFETTIKESKISNIQLKAQTTETEFIQFREKRDQTLSAPKLLLPSIQINIDAGQLPPKETNGKSYLKLPLNPQLPD